MKNKEIEVMEKYLNGLISYPFQHKDKEYILSYIEQLKVDYKEANESVIWWTNRYNAIVKQNDDNHKKVVKLENNRDKAIEYINEMSGYDVEDYIRQDLLLLLKGDGNDAR